MYIPNIKNRYLYNLFWDNVSKSIEEGDWLYMTYDEESNRFFFHYVDLANLPKDN